MPTGIKVSSLYGVREGSKKRGFCVWEHLNTSEHLNAPSLVFLRNFDYRRITLYYMFSNRDIENGKYYSGRELKARPRLFSSTCLNCFCFAFFFLLKSSSLSSPVSPTFLQNSSGNIYFAWIKNEIF